MAVGQNHAFDSELLKIHSLPRVACYYSQNSYPKSLLTNLENPRKPEKILENPGKPLEIPRKNHWKRPQWQGLRGLDSQ